MLYHLSCRRQIWNTGSGGIGIFVCKLNFWSVNCSQATTFLFDSRRDILEKVSKFWDRERLNPVGTLIPNLRIHAECLTIWAIRAKHLISHVLEYCVVTVGRIMGKWSAILRSIIHLFWKNYFCAWIIDNSDWVVSGPEFACIIHSYVSYCITEHLTKHNQCQCRINFRRTGVNSDRVHLFYGQYNGCGD